MKGILWIRPLVELPVSAMYPNAPREAHCTLLFGIDSSEADKVAGQKVEMRITAEAWNSRIQALMVDVLSIPRCGNVHPHISVSWTDGTKPVESNDMLNEDHHEIPVDFMLPGVIEFHPWG